MGVGQFRTRVTFRTRGATLDAFGQESTTYTDLITVGCELRILRGNERQNFSRGVETLEQFVRIVVPFRSNLSSISDNATFVIDGTQYEIVEVEEILRGVTRYIEFVGRRDR